MTDKKISSRGRPRSFDIETALQVGQRLFHAHGYEAVGLATLTGALGIKPPSFYKAFGSKAEFFAQVLDRYSRSVLTLEEILRPGRPAVEALAELLESAARTYAQDPEQRGCLVLEATRGNDQAESALLARRTAKRRRAQMREFVAHTHPQLAHPVTDYVTSVMSGLSASAREGMSEVRLVEVARAAVAGLEAIMKKPMNH